MTGTLGRLTPSTPKHQHDETKPPPIQFFFHVRKLFSTLGDQPCGWAWSLSLCYHWSWWFVGVHSSRNWPSTRCLYAWGSHRRKVGCCSSICSALVYGYREDWSNVRYTRIHAHICIYIYRHILQTMHHIYHIVLCASSYRIYWHTHTHTRRHQYDVYIHNIHIHI